MASYNDPNVKIDQLILERVLIQLTTVRSSLPIYLNDPQVQIRQFSHIADELAFTLSGWLVGNKFPDRSISKTISYPIGPWEAWKESYAPAWFTARWPVKMHTIRYESVTHYHICPHWSQDLKHKERHYSFLTDWQRGGNDETR